jgi:drug/metabolite transporter (DMT)-like permease
MRCRSEQAMNHAHLYLVSGLLSFSALGVLFKVADTKSCRPSAINMLLYMWSVLIAATLTTAQTGSAAGPVPVVAIALPFGMAASVGTLALQAGIRYGNISTSWLAINLSAFIPTLGSVLLYHEPVSPLKVVALFLIPISMVLLWKDKLIAERANSADQNAGTALTVNSKEAR